MTNLHETDRLVERASKLAAHLRNCATGTELLQDGAYQMSARRTIRTALTDAADAIDALTAMGGKAEPVATITELGEVMASDPAELRALFDAMPEEPHGGIKCLDVYASLVQARTGEVTEQGIAWQPGERDMAVGWLKRLLAKIGKDQNHVGDCLWVARMIQLLSEPSPLSSNEEQ